MGTDKTIRVSVVIRERKMHNERLLIATPRDLCISSL
jgi:hypothetical protein